MFSDAALAISVDTSIKWLYNASRRLKRPLQRTLADASWWRLTHHLAGKLGVPLADAARASDLLLRQGSDLSRIRLRSTSDDSVAIGVDLKRFHDGAALAAAAGLHLATPRRRGRPPHTRVSALETGRLGSAVMGDEASLRLGEALREISNAPETDGASPALVVLTALARAEVPSVIVGGVSSAVHGNAVEPQALDLVADFAARPARILAQTLNSLGAIPRSVSVREGFQLDSGLVRSAPCLALRIGELAVNITRDLAGVGEFPQAFEASSAVPLGELSVRVLSRDGNARAAAALARLRGPA